MAPKTSLDSSSGCRVNYGGRGVCRHTEDLLSKFSSRLVGFFPKAPGWGGRGTEDSGRGPLSPLPFCQHHQGGEVWQGALRPRVTWASPASARRPAEPRLPSRLTAQLVRSDSCQPAPPPTPAPKTAPGAAPRRSPSSSSREQCLPCARSTVSWRFGHVKSVF